MPLGTPILARGQSAALPGTWINAQTSGGTASRSSQIAYNPSPEPAGYANNSVPLSVVNDQVIAAVPANAGAGRYYAPYSEPTTDPAFPSGFRSISYDGVTPYTIFYVGCAPGWAYNAGQDACVPACDAVATPFATDLDPDDYTLKVTLQPGRCVGPLTNITWAPAPTSGQGSLTAVYTGRQYNTVYSGSVTGTDANGLMATAEFSFIQTIGVNPPSCQR